MHGLHLTADLRDCPVERPVMTEPAALRRLCLAAVEAAGLQAVAELFHRFADGAPGAPDARGQAPDPGPPAADRADAFLPTCPAAPGAAPTGITGVVLLAESHLAVHTWPETGAVTLDAYVCNRGADNSARAEALLAALIDAFAPARVERHALVRGAGEGDGLAGVAARRCNR